MIHVVENFREQLNEVSHIPTFQDLIGRYEQYVHNQDNRNLSSSVQGAPNQLANGEHLWREDQRAPDVEEEAYFNTSDDEGDLQDQRRHPPVPALVSYLGDEEQESVEDSESTLEVSFLELGRTSILYKRSLWNSE